MIRLVTFATPDMERSQSACVASGFKYSVDETHTFTTESLSPELREMFEGQRGYGFWLWKPIIIKEAMAQLGNGDYVIYADAGIEFIGNVNEIIRRMDQDIWLFGNNWEHAHWCKRDVVEEVWKSPSDYPADGHYRLHPWEAYGKQVQASVIFFRVTDYTRKFVKEWLNWCLFEGGRLIDDSPSRTPNHPEFREHRHDQAILTTMAYREGVKLHWWPASYNDGAFIYDKLPVYAADNYPVLFNHHRRRNHEWAKCA